MEFGGSRTSSALQSKPADQQQYVEMRAWVLKKVNILHNQLIEPCTHLS
jgi:hypothetical protein